MPSYLEIALRVTTPAQTMPSEPRPEAGAAGHVADQPHLSPGEIANKAQAQSKNLALYGSLDCAGCYDVGEGRRIHPPKCGEGYRNWLERWKPKGKVQ